MTSKSRSTHSPVVVLQASDTSYGPQTYQKWSLSTEPGVSLYHGWVWLQRQNKKEICRTDPRCSGGPGGASREAGGMVTEGIGGSMIKPELANVQGKCFTFFTLTVKEFYKKSKWAGGIV